MRRPRTVAFALLAAVPMLATATATTPATNNVKLEDMSVMALGALDGRAVLKGPDGKLQVVKVGDTIAGTHAVVAQVLADKIVAKDTVVGADKAPKTQTVWISKSTQPGGKSVVRRIDSEAPPARVIQGQVMNPLPVPAPGTSTKKAK